MSPTREAYLKATDTAPRVRLCLHLKGKERSSRIACWNSHIGVESRPKFVIETNIKFKSKAFLRQCEPSSQNQHMKKGLAVDLRA